MTACWFATWADSKSDFLRHRITDMFIEITVRDSQLYFPFITEFHNLYDTHGPVSTLVPSAVENLRQPRFELVPLARQGYFWNASKMKRIAIFGTAANVPSVLGEFRLKGIHWFDIPELGVQLRFRNGETVISDVYLYKDSSGHVSPEVTSQSFKKYFDLLIEGIMAHFRALGYNECAPLARDFIYCANLITPTYLCAGYMFRGRISDDAPSGILATVLALRSDEGYFNKVRISYDNDSRDQSAEQVMVFLVQWYFAVQSMIEHKKSPDGGPLG